MLYIGKIYVLFFNTYYYLWLFQHVILYINISIYNIGQYNIILILKSCKIYKYFNIILDNTIFLWLFQHVILYMNIG